MADAVVAAVARFDEDRRVGRRVARALDDDQADAAARPPNTPAVPSPPAPEKTLKASVSAVTTKLAIDAADRGKPAVARLDAAVGTDRAHGDMIDASRPGGPTRERRVR